MFTFEYDLTHSQLHVRRANTKKIPISSNLMMNHDKDITTSRPQVVSHEILTQKVSSGL